MALYDQFGLGQVGNGTGPANPQTAIGPVGFRPSGLAQGLQQFLASRGIAAQNPGMVTTQPQPMPAMQPPGTPQTAPGLLSGAQAPPAWAPGGTLQGAPQGYGGMPQGYGGMPQAQNYAGGLQSLLNLRGL